MFWGADTDQIREQAERTGAAGRRIEDLLGSLSSVVMTVDWQGPDAARFQQSWSEVSRNAGSCSAALRQRQRQLIDHADEQDEASSTTGPGAAAYAADVLTPIRDALRELFGGALPGAISTAFLPELGGSRSSEDTGYENPADSGDFKHTPGESSGSEKVTITLPDGSKRTVTLGDDGSASLTIDPPTYKEKIESGGTTAEVAVQVGDRIEIQRNPDGSMTYTVTGVASTSGEYGVSGKNVGGTVGGEVTTEAVYSITVPEGTSAADALRMNPFNPESIPPGASITTGAGVEAASSLEVSGNYKGIEATLGVERTVGQETNTVLARGEDGTLSVTSGPESMLKTSTSLAIGPKGGDLSLTLGQSHTHETAHLEHIEFSGDAAGNQAYLDMIHSGDTPKDTSVDGVTDRYSQEHSRSTAGNSLSVKVGDAVDVSRESNTFSDEYVLRTYPDGHKEWAQQVIPHGDMTGSNVLITGGTGRETDYQMTLKDVPHDIDMGYYGVSDGTVAPQGSDIRIDFSPEELAVMRESRSDWHGDEGQYPNEGYYLASVVATEAHHGPEGVLQDLHREYNVRPVEPNNWHDTTPIHDELKVPGSYEIVRD